MSRTFLEAAVDADIRHVKLRPATIFVGNGSIKPNLEVEGFFIWLYLDGFSRIDVIVGLFVHVHIVLRLLEPDCCCGDVTYDLDGEDLLLIGK